MENNHTIDIRNNVDVIMMRTEVRNTARQLGMGMMDQASISLAASGLAHDLGLGCIQEGLVLIERLEQENRVGLRVICMNKPSHEQSNLTAKALQDAKWMVDEVKVETLPAQVVKVTLVKWMS